MVSSLSYSARYFYKESNLGSYKLTTVSFSLGGAIKGVVSSVPGSVLLIDLLITIDQFATTTMQDGLFPASSLLGTLNLAVGFFVVRVNGSGSDWPGAALLRCGASLCKDMAFITVCVPVCYPPTSARQSWHLRGDCRPPLL